VPISTVCKNFFNLLLKYLTEEILLETKALVMAALWNNESYFCIFWAKPTKLKTQKQAPSSELTEFSSGAS